MNKPNEDVVQNDGVAPEGVGAHGGAPLPKGWRWVKLGNVCHIVSGSTPNTNIQDYWNGDIVWITPTDLGRLKYIEILTSERLITKAGYDSCGVETISPDSVVMSSRAPIGHLGIAKVPLCTNQGCKSFICGENLDPMFLFYNLRREVPRLQ